MAKKESKLEEIYQLVEYSKKTGIELKEDQLQQIAEREERISRKRCFHYYVTALSLY